MAWSHLFQKSLQAFSASHRDHTNAKAGLHFAGHSHHPWPDVTREAHLQAWDDAAKHLDLKWDKVLGEVLPQARDHLVRLLGLSKKYSSGESLVFAPNTHDLVSKVFSCLPAFQSGGEVSVLTTDSEFYSFSKQLKQWELCERVQVTVVPTLPLHDFEERFIKAFDGHDVVYLSRVFFNSGAVFEGFSQLLTAVAAWPETVVIVDDYHGFCALPLDLSPYEDRFIYLAGGYKYAMSGEGACFMHLPQAWSQQVQPMTTGWLSLGNPKFSGGTQEVTPWYRFNAVQALWQKEGLTVARIHEHVQKLERLALQEIAQIPSLSRQLPWMLADSPQRTFGHFLTFQTPQATEWVDRLIKTQGVLTDSRGDRFRIGFGIYHTEDDVRALVERLGAVSKSLTL